MSVPNKQLERAQYNSSDIIAQRKPNEVNKRASHV